MVTFSTQFDGTPAVENHLKRVGTGWLGRERNLSDAPSDRTELFNEAGDSVARISADQRGSSSQVA